MEFRAQARFMRVSPQKARLVLDLIKGRRVEDALNTLIFTKKRVAATVEKLLRSALENANYLSSEKGLDVDVDNLYVKRAIANDGPRMKRIRPAPMGRAYHYVRRISHIEIELAERGKNGDALANVVGAERVHATSTARSPEPKPRAKRRQRRAKPRPPRNSREQDRVRQGCQERRWDKKFILMVFASATQSRGSRVGLPSAITTSSCSKTSS